MAKTVTLVLTPAQLRLVNSGLALIEADPEEAHGFSTGLIERTREKVWDCFRKTGWPT